MTFPQTCASFYLIATPLIPLLRVKNRCHPWFVSLIPLLPILQPVSVTMLSEYIPKLSHPDRFFCHLPSEPCSDLLSSCPPRACSLHSPKMLFKTVNQRSLLLLKTTRRLLGTLRVKPNTLLWPVKLILSWSMLAPSTFGSSCHALSLFLEHPFFCASGPSYFVWLLLILLTSRGALSDHWL